ncbi:MAG TPA: hypothetical protein VGM72_12605, partial [Micropepsaceae bacterium]
RIAQVGARLIDATAKSLAEQFFKKFAAVVEKPQAAAEPMRETTREPSRNLGLFARIWAAIVRFLSGPAKTKD